LNVICWSQTPGPVENLFPIPIRKSRVQIDTAAPHATALTLQQAKDTLMLDAADLLGVFAEAILRSANSSSQKSRFSNYIGSDLDGAIGFIDEPTPNGLIKHVGLTSGRVLDFGCGLGPHRSLLEQSGLHWTGLDYNGTIDPTALKRGADLENEIVKYDGGSLLSG
jgi:2-polyprenyl-3-methyl-5-hydroxy-6-metoxy-1,4-benzoquinol methylase